MYSSHSQFGCIKGLSCSNAIHSVNYVICSENNNTIAIVLVI